MAALSEAEAPEVVVSEVLAAAVAEAAAQEENFNGGFMKKAMIVLGVVVVLAVIIGGWYIAGINNLVALHENINASWSQVENQLQRRADLIPNLVNTVKGYMTHERELLEKITELRSQWQQAGSVQQKIDSANQMTTALSKLLLVSENYPNLKANENFLTLQSQLEGTENRIATERMRYNDSVRAFNTYIRTVFGKFFAKRRGLESTPGVYFEAVKGAETAPKVEF